MDIDDSFKQPGAIPFKWEIRPGVPKIQQQQPTSPSYNLHRSLLQHQQQQSFNHRRSSPITPVKLRPPPAGFYFQPPPPELRTRSFQSVPRARSESSRFDLSSLARPDPVATGCFPAPLLRRKDDKKKKRIHRPTKPEFGPEPDYTSDLETLSRWSVSTRKSLSPFRDSPLSSSFSSYRSSPRPAVSDAEWAGFGLF